MKARDEKAEIPVLVSVGSCTERKIGQARTQVVICTLIPDSSNFLQLSCSPICLVCSASHAIYSPHGGSQASCLVNRLLYNMPLYLNMKKCVGQSDDCHLANAPRVPLSHGTNQRVESKKGARYIVMKMPVWHGQKTVAWYYNADERRPLRSLRPLLLELCVSFAKFSLAYLGLFGADNRICSTWYVYS